MVVQWLYLEDEADDDTEEMYRNFRILTLFGKAAQFH